MHPLILLGALTRATLLVVVAWFVWFAAARAAGLLKLLGMALGAWLVVLAALTLFLRPPDRQWPASQRSNADHADYSNAIAAVVGSRRHAPSTP